MAKFIKTMLVGGAGTSTALGDFGLTLLRVTSGALLAYGHGLGKIYENGQFGLSQGIINSTKAMNFPMPVFFATCAMIAELVGGICLALGLGTRFSAFLIACTMGVAVFIRHADDALRTKELALVYLAVAIFFMLVGGGRYAVDRYLR